ncbi:hypothetical protein CW751_04680 [Brumimicrobium salinarum]|uniref:HTH arsR-type domain-containing protein n=1 Tax=Brumimicrobium salinarum TaxID=2058658 RepID=A0A2I0R448_9FLAO|nr:OST-HTH/LOTUS domain-containing protein [Brumimicrobium salinarum]PKR81355.1 hypothetical protein CW751_04680 [Brumimicrobium salinarum]
MYIDLGNILAIVSLILGLIALIITIVGFFASLKFYRDGVSLQDSANKALAKIEEKTSSIQTQIGGMFDKTLDAAIKNNKGVLVSQDFDDISDQLENVKDNLIKNISNEISSIGTEEKNQMKQLFEEQFRIITDQVNISQENTEDLFQQSENESLPVTQFQLKILNGLRNSEEKLTVSEISDKLGVSVPVVSRDLIRLKRKRLVNETSEGPNKKYSIADFGEKELSVLIDEAFQRASINNNEPHLAKVGVEIKKIDPDFHPRKYGFNNLSELLDKQDRFEIIENFVNGLNHPIVKKK